MADEKPQRDLPPLSPSEAQPLDTPNPARPGSADSATNPQSPEELARAVAGLRPPPDPVGIPGYALEQELGRGGMGVVYRGRQLSLNRLVAVKLALTGRLAERELQRFLAEAETVAAVKHPNVVQAYDYGEISGRPYIVFELCDGGSLADRLRKGVFDPPAAVELVAKVASGVAAAHARGIVHRDLKPGNVLFDSDGEPKVADFGIAKLVASDLTATQAFLGTPAYMSPEQARGEAKFVGPEADVWALGVILYECLTGSRPFDATTPDEMRAQVLFGAPRPLRAHLPAVSRDLETLCLKCLNHRPAQRFRSAAELVAELRRFADGSPRPSLRRRVRPSVLAGYGLAAVIGAGASLWLIPPPVPAAKSDTPTTRTSIDPAVSPPVSVTSSPSESGSPPRLLLPGDTGAVWVITPLDADRVVVGNESGALRIWNLRTGAPFKTLVREDGPSPNVWAADVSVDGKYLMTASDDSAVTFWSLQTFQAEFTFPESISTKTATFSPDGRFLATGNRNSTVKVWDWAHQVPLLELHHRGTVHSLSYSPDGKKLASAGSDGKIKVWDLKDVNGEKREMMPKVVEMAEHRGAVNSVVFDPKGTHLASAGYDGTVRIWDATYGTQIWQIKAHDRDAWSVCFSPDGKLLAACGSDGYVRAWEVPTGKEAFSYRGTTAFHVVKFGPDGTLAAGGHDGTVRVWDMPKK